MGRAICHGTPPILSALRGAALEAALDDVARLRIAVFRDWPYLYDGSLEYEREYLTTYRDSPGALLVGAFVVLAWVGPTAADSPVLPAAIVGLCIAALSASLDAAVDAHRTDSASGGEEGPAASAFVLGYRVAFVSIGAAVLMLHGRIALLLGPEGDPAAEALASPTSVTTLRPCGL